MTINVQRCIALASGFIVFALGLSLGHAVQAAAPNQAAGFVSAGEHTYFTAYDSENGNELWVTDGTFDGTHLVYDVNPGVGDSWAYYLTYVSETDTLYFVADDGTHAQELWKTDGTTEGTMLVKDIVPGNTTSNPYFLVDIDGTIYFQANDSGYDYEIWKTDGTEEGTVRVKDINTSGSSYADNLVNVNDTLFFQAIDDVYGSELMKSDGTEEGTTVVKDINATGSSSPSYITAVNNAAYFFADDGVHGNELWKSDGTADGTVLVKDSVVGLSGFTNTRTYVYGDRLIFAADDGTHGKELWISDGTEEGTLIVKDINPSGDSAPANFAQFGDDVYFAATDGVHGVELWKTDGTAGGTKLVSDISSLGDSSPSLLKVMNGVMYFMADDGVHGVELWKTNGTTSGTEMIKDMNPIGNGLSEFCVFGSNLLIEADDGSFWQSDGTEEGTVVFEGVAVIDSMITSVEEGKDGKIIVHYQDGSVQMYDIFSQDTSRPSSIQRFKQTDNWLVLSGNGKKLAFVDAVTGETMDDTTILSHGTSKQQFMATKNFHAKRGGSTEIVVAVKTSAGVQVRILQVKDHSFVKKGLLKLDNKKIDLSKTKLIGNRVVLRNTHNKPLNAYTISLNYQFN